MPGWMLYCTKTEIPNGWILTDVKGGVEQQKPILEAFSAGWGGRSWL